MENKLIRTQISADLCPKGNFYTINLGRGLAMKDLSPLPFLNKSEEVILI